MPTTTKKRTSVAADVFDAAAAASAAQSAVDALTSQSAAQTVHMLAPTVLHPHPRNPRKSFGDLTELQQSIAANGILQPVTAVPHPDLPGEYRILLGHCRTECARLLELPFVPVMVRTDLDEAAQLEAMLVENIQRADLTVIEEGAGYQGLLDLGVKRTVIAQHTGRAVSTVTQRVKVASLPEAFHPAVVEKQLTLEEAVAFADLRDAGADEFSDAVEKLAAGFASGPAMLVRSAMMKVVKRERIAKAVDEWKQRGWDLRVDHSDRHAEISAAGAVQIRGGLAWELSDHEASGCKHGVAFILSDWMNNVEGWGTFYCFKPSNHKDRIAEVAAEEAARAQARISTPPPLSPEVEAAREAARLQDESLAEAAAARRAHACRVLAGTSDEAREGAALLMTFAVSTVHDPQFTTDESYGPKVDMSVYEDESLDGIDGPARLVLAIVSMVEGVVPSTHYEFGYVGDGDQDHIEGRIAAYLRVLEQTGYELSQWETRLLEVIDTAQTGIDVEPDADEADAS